MTDVFPRRNLSSDSEPWGREVESRIVTLEGIAGAAKSGISGQNRTTAATLGDLSRQLARLDALYRSIPKPSQATWTATGFGLASGWQSIASVSIMVPDGSNSASIYASGSGFLTNTAGSVIAGSMRLVAGGNASTAQPWSTFSDVGGFHASITPSYSWTLSVTAGTPLNIGLQVNPADAATWGANTSNYATVAALVSFTG